MIPQFLDAVRTAVEASLTTVLNLRHERRAKDDGSFVTHGDLLMQEQIALIASGMLGDHIFLSEENACISPESSETIVVVDPIDGTENFTSGLPIWGLSISCYQHGRHVASLIGCPELGSWIRTGDQIQRFESRIRGLSSSLSKDDLITATSGYEYRILGCCVYNMISVIQGSFVSFENPKGAYSWDILAGLNLALEHGLHVFVEGKLYAGEYLEPHRRYRFRIENQ
jgi:myo-inositol-1(or 4)-monophosphatase